MASKETDERFWTTEVRSFLTLAASYRHLRKDQVNAMSDHLEADQAPTR